MAYTNIASPYWTGNWGPAANHFNKHSWTLFNRDNPHFSKAQFKVAMQQLQQQGVLDNSRGWAGSKLKSDILEDAPGIGSNQNPLGKFQGREGNFGGSSYDEAKRAGWSAQDIFDEIQRGRSGMQMMGGAMDKYNIDIAEAEAAEQAAYNEAKWRTDLQTNLTDLHNQINEPVAPPGVGYSASSVVGKSGTRGANLKIAERGSRSGTKRWKRGGDSSWSMATVNTGGTSGKASNSSAVNV